MNTTNDSIDREQPNFNIAEQSRKRRETGFYDFKIGSLRATVISDGAEFISNDNQFFGVGQTAEAVADVLQNAGLSRNRIELDFNPLVIRDRDRTVLIDTGFGKLHDFAGKLLQNLRRAGIEPPQITDVIISHAHPDHLSGAFDDKGELSFPNARHYISELDWQFFVAQPDAKKKMQTLKPQLRLVQPNREIVPHITAIHAPGHTPGQLALRIEADAESLLFVGDAVHHFVISLQRPQWHVGKDFDPQLAVETRRNLLERAASENLLVHGYHFPFPGVGRILARGNGFEWQPQ